jgi:hypothetical protein
VIDNPGIPKACPDSIHVDDKETDNQNEKKQPKDIDCGLLL